MKRLQVFCLLMAGALSGALLMKALPKLGKSPRVTPTTLAQAPDSALTLARATPSIDSESSARTVTKLVPTPSPEVKPTTRRRAPLTTTRKTQAARRPKAASVARSRLAGRSFPVSSLFPPAPGFRDSRQVHGATRGNTFRIPDFFVDLIVQARDEFPFFRITTMGDPAGDHPALSDGIEAPARKLTARRGGSPDVGKGEPSCALQRDVRR